MGILVFMGKMGYTIARKQKEHLRMYDLTVITDSSQDTAQVTKHIEHAKGTVVAHKELGTKPLAYPIDKKTEGTYTMYILDIEPSNVKELDQELRLDSSIIRHLLLKTDSKELPKFSEETAEQPRMTRQAPESTIAKPVKKVEKAATPTKEEESKRKKEVDKKLEEILQA